MHRGPENSPTHFCLTTPASGVGARDDIAVELARASDMVIALLSGIEVERLIIGELLPDTDHDARVICAATCRWLHRILSLRSRRALAVERLADALFLHRSLNCAQVDAHVRAFI